MARRPPRDKRAGDWQIRGLRWPDPPGMRGSWPSGLEERVRAAGEMTYDYKRYLDTIAVIRDLTTMPEKAGRRTTAPVENDEQHPIVPERLRMPKMRSRRQPRVHSVAAGQPGGVFREHLGSYLAARGATLVPYTDELHAHGGAVMA